MLKWSVQLIPRLRIFLEKPGYWKVLGTQNNVCPCLWSNRQSRGNGWILGLKKNRGVSRARKKTQRERKREGEEGWRTAREGRECVVWEPCARARRVCDWSCSRHRMTHTGGSTRPHSHTHTLIYKCDVCKLWQQSKNRRQHTGTCIQQLVLCNESNPTQTGKNSMKRQVATKPSEAKSRAIQNWFNEIRL